MNSTEILKRVGEYLQIYHSQVKYRTPSKWPYSRFCSDHVELVVHSLPSVALENDWKSFSVYSWSFNLTKPLDWYFSPTGGGWPVSHYATINYRPGNEHGDIRINWELNRLQFLPVMSVTDQVLAKKILTDWLVGNPFLHGPGYSAAMEVALRWLSVYWAVCLFDQPLDKSLKDSVTGLAVASGQFIESRLSTHSSAGNHLIVEAVGLFWIGKALENSRYGVRWMTRARTILWEQICRQLNPDGANQEQSFWYLGFVIDALFHYVLLEDRSEIPAQVWERIEKSLEFMNDLVLPDGSFPDYGDRDDGFAFRMGSSYGESPFPGLLNIGSVFFNRPEWRRDTCEGNKRLAFWTGRRFDNVAISNKTLGSSGCPDYPIVKEYKDGGMTLMLWGHGRLLFRHAPLGLASTFGHGHADALSVLFYWKNTPVLVDLGSGQYNGDQSIRNYFRSTIAHNTVEIGGENQSRILGPFMWDKSYNATMNDARAKVDVSSICCAEASHDGYLDEFSVIHTRRVSWLKPNNLVICDSFTGRDGVGLRGAFHLGCSHSVVQKGNTIEAQYDEFSISFVFPTNLSVKTYNGSNEPFIGWKSTVYGNWTPIDSIVFTGVTQESSSFRIELVITER